MKALGRTQSIAVGALLAPFLVISAALFTGKASVAEWSSFLQFFFPSIVIPLLAGGAAVKMKAAPKAPEAQGEAQA